MVLDVPLETLNVCDPSAGFPLRNDDDIGIVEYCYLFVLIIKTNNSFNYHLIISNQNC